MNAGAASVGSAPFHAERPRASSFTASVNNNTVWCCRPPPRNASAPNATALSNRRSSGQGGLRKFSISEEEEDR